VYAVIEDSGQQFKVSAGDVISIDLRELKKNAKKIQFDRVLLTSDEGKVKVGTPLLSGAKVQAEVLDPMEKGPKVYHVTLRRRKNSRTKKGHRQKYMRVRISEISVK